MNYIEYIKHIGGDEFLTKWADSTLKNHLEKNKVPTEEVEHILDYLAQCNKKIERMSYIQAKKLADAWTKSLQKKGAEIKETEYVNVETILKEEKDITFPELYRDKYFNKNLLDKVENKDRISLWGLFGLFEFSSNMKVRFNFDVDKSVGFFREKLSRLKNKGNSNKVAMQDDNQVAMQDYNKVAMEDSNKVAMQDDNQVAMQDYNQVAMQDYNKVAMENYNQVAVEDYNQVAMENDNKVAMENYNQVAVGHYNQVAVGYHNQLAVRDYNQVAVGYYNQLAVRDSNKVAMEDSNKVAMQDDNQVAMENYNIACGECKNEVSFGEKSIVLLGKESKAKGKIGSWFCLFERESDGEISNAKLAQIDGKKIKEDTWYELKNGRLVQAK